jgi:CRISPR-associated endoribonuclease Cas6
MLIAILLILTAEHDAVLPAHLGRANYAETLKRIGQLDAALATQIHEGEGPKPLTCSSLLSLKRPDEQLVITRGQQLRLRITGLTTAVSQALLAGLLQDQPSHWQLHEQQFTVNSVFCDPQQDPWAGQTTYEELASGQLLQGTPPRQVTLEFASPTAFKSGGLTMPFPLPGLVFGSLVERWNTFSPITLAPEMRRYGEEMIAISRYRMESRVVEQKNQGIRIGGVGRVTYVATGGDRYWQGVMNMLANFARYSGVGVQTATGMGQVRRVG